MTERTKYRAELLERLRRLQATHRLTGSAAAQSFFELIEEELILSSIRLDDDERRQLLWLSGGELHTLATIVALMVLPHSGPSAAKPGPV
jgi:hypothetical protein